MRDEFFPAFDLRIVFEEPWTSNFEGTFQIVLMGFLVCLACGLIGNFVVARRLALVGDAISHSLLPGIAIAFVFTTGQTAVQLADTSNGIVTRIDGTYFSVTAVGQCMKTANFGWIIRIATVLGTR